MAIKKPDWKRLRDKLKNVYRFQIVDEKSYDVKMVLELSRLNVIVVTGLLLAFFTLLNFLLIAFTPLKQYIPGYGTSSGRKEVIKMNMKAEELEDKMKAHQKYADNLHNILNDKVVVDAVKSKLTKAKVDPGILSVKATDESRFVKDIEKGLQNAELMKSVHDSKTNALKNLSLRRPVGGKIISIYKQEKPYITFAAGVDEEVKAVLPGSVILEGELAGGAYIAIQSENQLVYILKNNSKILKKTGNFVRAGETVALAGKLNATGYASSLELWYKGQSFDPSKFIK